MGTIGSLIGLPTKSFAVSDPTAWPGHADGVLLGKVVLLERAP
jgi:hypothetical protein